MNEPLRPLGLVQSKLRQLQESKYIPVIVNISSRIYSSFYRCLFQIYPNDTLHQIRTATEVFEWIRHRAESTETLLNATS